MKITDILGMVGGLALFLYGMRMMGDGLEHLAGSKLKSILEKLTRNRFMAMLVGLLLTVLVQSSSATTVMAVGFVNAGLMDFSRAIGVIMGANIGTTITAQLIALKVTTIAPIFAFVGVVLYMFTKKSRPHNIGQVLAGLGILFIGMDIMSSSMAPLREVVWFQQAITSFSNPLVGVAVGTLFTMLIQSSSASIGVMQALAMQGLIGLDSSIYVLFGMNIGTTITAILASIGGNKNAHRTALVHLLFNAIGAIIFIVIAQTLPFVSWVESFSPGDVVKQIANAHTIFNIVTTLLLLPAANLLEKIAMKFIPGTDIAQGPQLMHIQDMGSATGFGASTIAIGQVDEEVSRMHLLARDNLHAALEALFDPRTGDIDSVYSKEEIIDFLNKEITRALVRINAMELTYEDARRMGAMYHVLSDIERIGDHAENVAEYAEFCREHDQAFSERATHELHELADMVYQIVDDSFEYFVHPQPGGLERISDLEEAIDQKVEQMQCNHVERLNEHSCTADIGMLFVEILTDLERVSDHALNIAQAATKADKK